MGEALDWKAEVRRGNAGGTQRTNLDAVVGMTAKIPITHPKSFLCVPPAFPLRTSAFLFPAPTSPLHVASILPAHLEQRMGDLPERADAHRVHQDLEHVGVGDHRLAQALQH